MNKHTPELSTDTTELQELVRKQSLQIDYLTERIDLLLAQLYGKTSEKHSSLPHPDQLSYLDDATEETLPEDFGDVVVPTHTRKKSGRKPLPEELERVEVIHDIPEEQKTCECGSTLSRIGEETSEQLNYIPARLEVIRHIRPKYACKSCEGIESSDSTVKVAPAPKQMIEKSIASPNLLAHIIVAKFVDALPFYRQEKQFLRLGYELSRTNMANWTIQLGIKLKKLLDLLRYELLSGPLIHMDETTIQVLKETNRLPHSKSYMWVMRSGASDKPGVLYHYSPSRASTVARGLLTHYKGIVQSDGYAGYDFLDDSEEIQHAGCWAHSRRKFMEVLKAKGNYHNKRTKCGHAEQAVGFIRQLYATEHKADEEELSGAQRTTRRRQESKPLLEAFYTWLQGLLPQTPPKGLLGKAVSYTLGQWPRLSLFVDHGIIPLDNNRAENAIRPFVIGRKNWLFCDTVEGAKASAALYSLIETAKANDLNPYDYLKMLFETFPGVETTAQLKALLPQYYASPPDSKKQGVV